MEVNWNEAPEDATHFRIDSEVCKWYKYENGIVYYMTFKGWLTSVEFKSITDSNYMFIKRPEQQEKQMNKQEWKEGIDLPPIGETVVVHDEMPHKSYKEIVGSAVTIIAHDKCDKDDVAVFKVQSRDGSGYIYYALIARCFKKIKTKEQLEAEEREKAIDQMWLDITTEDKCDIPIQKKVIADLYDAGYRKVV